MKPITPMTSTSRPGCRSRSTRKSRVHPDQMLKTPTPATERPATTTRTRPPGIPSRVAVMLTVDCRLVCPDPTAKAAALHATVT